MKKVVVCINFRVNPEIPSCAARGSLLLADLIESSIKENEIDIKLERFMCLGKCVNGPNLKLVPGGRFINGAHPDKILPVMEEIRAFAAASDQDC